MIRKGRIAYYLIKICLVILGLSFMILGSMFYIGSKEQFDKSVQDDFIKFFLIRYLFVLGIGLIFLTISYLINYLFRNKLEGLVTKIRRFLIIESILVFLFSFILTYIFFNH